VHYPALDHSQDPRNNSSSPSPTGLTTEGCGLRDPAVICIPSRHVPSRLIKASRSSGVLASPVPLVRLNELRKWFEEQGPIAIERSTAEKNIEAKFRALRTARRNLPKQVKNTCPYPKSYPLGSRLYISELRARFYVSKGKSPMVRSLLQGKQLTKSHATSQRATTFRPRGRSFKHYLTWPSAPLLPFRPVEERPKTLRRFKHEFRVVQTKESARGREQNCVPTDVGWPYSISSGPPVTCRLCGVSHSNDHNIATAKRAPCPTLFRRTKRHRGHQTLSLGHQVGSIATRSEPRASHGGTIRCPVANWELQLYGSSYRLFKT
jgi:hypothetical protein